MHCEMIRPGDILHDERGLISGSNPTTYVVLSADRPWNKATQSNERRIWKVAKFHDPCGYPHWTGAQVVELWDEDIECLVRVGRLQKRHTYWPRWEKSVAKFKQDFYQMISIARFQWKYGKKFWENKAYWDDQQKKEERKSN